MEMMERVDEIVNVCGVCGMVQLLKYGMEYGILYCMWYGME